MPIAARASAPLLGCIERGGDNVRWQKAHVRMAEFDKMQVDASKVVDERYQGSFTAAAPEVYDNLLHNVVDDMYQRDGVVSRTDQEKHDADYADLQVRYNRQRLVLESLRSQQNPPASADEIELAEGRERSLMEQLLTFDTVELGADDVAAIAAAAKSKTASGDADGIPKHKQHNFTQILNRVHLCYEKKQAEFITALRQPSLIDRIVNPVELNKYHVTGRETLNIIREILDSFGMERSDMQKTFHEDMIGACAKLIFGPDLLAELDDLLIELGIDELTQQFMAITPRRMGKTYSVAMFVVALMFGVKGLEQAIFSTGRRASQKLIELVYRLMCKIPGMRESIVKHNVETIWIQGPYGEDDVRKVFSYPSNVRISLFCFSFVVLFSRPPFLVPWNWMLSLNNVGRWTRRAPAT